MNGDAVVRAQGLGKAYSIHASSWRRLRSLFARGADAAQQWALRDVTFQLSPGQCLGIVGDNGAGKSTLLKLVAGTFRPSEGTLSTRGRLTAILELGAGFHPEFTGRQNLYFGGALIGIDEKQMQSVEEAIINFSELADAIDRPLKTYSSGMAVRLAFALVTAIEPDILIIDEALAVGDQHFQRKCLERIEAFRSNGCTILFCSHSLYHVRQLCDVVLWVDGGRMRGLGPTENVLAAYETHVRNLNAADHDISSVDMATGTPQAADQPHRARLLAVDVDGLGEGAPPVLESRDLAIRVTAELPDGERPSLAVMLERADRVCITAVGTHADGVVPNHLGDGRWQATVMFPGLPLYSGEYVVSAYLFDASGTLVYEEWRDCRRFMVVYPTLEVGLVRLSHTWS